MYLLRRTPPILALSRRLAKHFNGRRLAPSHHEDEETLKDIEDEISNKTGTKWIVVVGLFDHFLMALCMRPKSSVDVPYSIASEALTEPRVSSITVRVDVLYIWVDQWEESHRHAEPGGEGCVFGRDLEEQEAEGERDPDADADDDEGELILLCCCGTNRPKTHTPLVVKLPSASGRQYITVHDYLSAVHPWLVAQWNGILEARDVWEDRSPSAVTKLAVNYHGPEHLLLDDVESWLSFMKGGRHIPQVNTSETLFQGLPLNWGPRVRPLG